MSLSQDIEFLQGLVLIEVSLRKFSLLNPTTGFIKRILDFATQYSSRRFDSSVYGFGYAYKIDDYCVVNVSWNNLSSLKRKSFVLRYTPEEDAWNLVVP